MTFTKEVLSAGLVTSTKWASRSQEAGVEVARVGLDECGAFACEKVSGEKGRAGASSGSALRNGAPRYGSGS